MGAQGEAIWHTSSLSVYSDSWKFFPPCAFPVNLWEGPLDSFASSSPLQFLSLCGDSFLMLVSDGSHSFLQFFGVALSSLISFTAAFVEMVPTAPLPLLCSLLLPLSLQNFTQGEKLN